MLEPGKQRGYEYNSYLQECAWRDSDPRPSVPKTDALSTELQAQIAGHRIPEHRIVSRIRSVCQENVLENDAFTVDSNFKDNSDDSISDTIRFDPLFAEDEPGPANSYHLCQVRIMVNSLERLTGRQLYPDFSTDNEDVAKAIFDAPFALVSHGTQPDPIFNYANRTALTLFEMTWAEFTALPSRMSAEPLLRDERERLMLRVRNFGYIDDYQGIRISSSGHRFRIERATVWNLYDHTNNLTGQAAMFSQWTPVSEP